jgi:hypothetical protein
VLSDKFFDLHIEGFIPKLLIIWLPADFLSWNWSRVTISLMGGHHNMMTIFNSRQGILNITYFIWRNKERKAMTLKDFAIIVDILSVMMRPSVWTSTCVLRFFQRSMALSRVNMKRVWLFHAICWCWLWGTSHKSLKPVYRILFGRFL